MPVLALWGDGDRVVPVSRSKEIILGALRKAGNPNLTEKSFAGANHSLLLVPTGGWDFPRIAPGYPEFLSAWLQTQTTQTVGTAQRDGAVPKSWQLFYNRISKTIAGKDVKSYMTYLDRRFVNIRTGKKTGYAAYEKAFRDFLKPFSHIKADAIASNFRKHGNRVVLDYHYTFSGQFKAKDGTLKTLRFFEDGVDTWRKIGGKYLQVIEDVKKQGVIPAGPARTEAMAVHRIKSALWLVVHGDRIQVSAEELCSRHEIALGGLAKIRLIKSFIKHGTYTEGSLKLTDTRIMQMRPFYRVIGDTTKLDDIREGYDGSAWEYYPDPGLVVRTIGAAAATTRHSAMFDDPLVEPVSRHISVVLAGKATIDGKETYVLHVTLPDGFREDLYLHEKNYMICATDKHSKFHAFGKDLPIHNIFEDYRPEGGVMMEHRDREVNSATGETLTESTVTSVEINPVLPASMFSPPSWDRTPVQEMIRLIYDERDEPSSALSTYYDYMSWIDRAKSPTVDAVDFVGYQCLKMGHTDTAIALLSANVEDNPTSARARYGLGRAYRTSGSRSKAIEQFRKALQIDPNYKRASEALREMA